MASLVKEKRSLISSQARIQVPWIKVTIGEYTFGIFNRTQKEIIKGDKDQYIRTFNVQYPNYVQSLNITKINGQVNQYKLTIIYPITQYDDPNFFEKIFSSVSSTRKIVFSYGDWTMPSYCYKDEEAIITKVGQIFNLDGSSITYTVEATSTSTLGLSGSYSFGAEKNHPSSIIKRIFNSNSVYHLQDLFTGMAGIELNKFMEMDDDVVEVEAKTNISVLDYLTYLVSCMVPKNTLNNIASAVYVLTIHDDTVYDTLYSNRPIIDGKEVIGPYFKVSKVTYAKEQSDAYEIDIGFMDMKSSRSTIVTNFNLEQNENYSLYYDYQTSINKTDYALRINSKTGEQEKVYAPTITSKNGDYLTRPDDISWWTKITKYPVNATITVQGLLRPAQLMQYIRLNVIFPGGHKHISSGLYIITKQVDQIDGSGYRTTLSLTKINGDSDVY